MTQSVELLLGAEAERVVRERWDRLRKAGLPSLADHTGETNRPHVTLGVAKTIDDNTETRLQSLVSHLPVNLGLGGLVAFHSGADRVLAWLVVPNAELLALHAQATGLLPSPMKHLQVGAWTPHVTLARRVPVERLGKAARALGDLPELATTGSQLRRWDSVARRTWMLGD